MKTAGIIKSNLQGQETGVTEFLAEMGKLFLMYLKQSDINFDKQGIAFANEALEDLKKDKNVLPGIKIWFAAFIGQCIIKSFGGQWIKSEELSAETETTYMVVKVTENLHADPMYTIEYQCTEPDHHKLIIELYDSVQIMLEKEKQIYGSGITVN